MSSRVDASTKSALKTDKFTPADLIRIESLGCSDPQYTDQTSCELNSEVWTGELLYTSHDVDVTYDFLQGSGAETFKAGNVVSSLSVIDENIQLDFGTSELELNANDGFWLRTVQVNQIDYKTVKIYRALIDPDTGNLIGKPFLYLSGSVIGASVIHSDSDEGSKVQLELSKGLYSFDKVAGFSRSAKDHQRFFPSDTTYEGIVNSKKVASWPT